jgi:hypothetical protein
LIAVLGLIELAEQTFFYNTAYCQVYEIMRVQ